MLGFVAHRALLSRLTCRSLLSVVLYSPAEFDSPMIIIPILGIPRCRMHSFRAMQHVIGRGFANAER